MPPPADTAATATNAPDTSPSISLADSIARAKGTGNASFSDLLAARQTVLKSLIQHLTTSPKKAKGIKTADWLELVEYLHKDLSPNQKTALARKIRNIFCADAMALAALSPADARNIVRTIWTLDPECARDLLEKFFSDETLWTPWPVDVLATLARLSGEPWMGKVLEIHYERPGCMMTMDAQRKLDLIAKAADAKNALIADVLEDLARAFSNAGAFDEAQFWGQKTYAARIGTLTTLTGLTDLADFMFYTVLCAPERDYPEYAAKLVALLDARGVSTEPVEYRILAFPLIGKATRNAVQKIVFQKGREPNVALVQVLAWAYRETDNIANLSNLVDQELAKTGNNPDLQMQWKLAQAALIGLRGSQPNLLRHYAAMRDMASHPSCSLKIRQQAVAGIVENLRLRKQTYAAIRHLQDTSVTDGGKFSGDRVLANALAAEDKQQQQNLDRERFWINQASLRARIGYYQGLVEKAKANGDSKAMDTHRNQVTKLETGLIDR
jgi:hypothetical protein